MARTSSILSMKEPRLPVPLKTAALNSCGRLVSYGSSPKDVGLPAAIHAGVPSSTLYSISES